MKKWKKKTDEKIQKEFFLRKERKKSRIRREKKSKLVLQVN